MSIRAIFGFALAAFLVVGGVGYVAAMPRPAQMVGLPVAEQVPLGASVTVLPKQVGIEGGDSGQQVTIDGQWMLSIGATAGIPARALQAYASAANTIDTARPDCQLGWNTLAAIGMVESEHGTHGGASIGPDGQLIGSILGPVLDGVDFDAVPDTDRGVLDGDSQWDRAVGPFQFIPSTWAAYGVDASGDGVADPNQIDDAALTAAVYLCTAGQDLSTDAGWTAAVRAYNNNDDYVSAVRTQSAEYAQLAG
ncbi:Transglycosylase SLT domain-containing protein [Agreia bicolorata]|uniref:Transglycosylase SLT domain-containing protein n=1 Tax=Agreia bicolorata TaxID=110935 RepID=A0A1T4WW46_9MICO|nr:lytic murein transglycosylase [Agreia bicolorata]SKA81357.1 Transglycosylase SLT domain-containing protein [Agreia bicolorata]